MASASHKGDVGPRSDRQECPHAHAVAASPNNKFVLASDLGLDRLIVYRFDDRSGALTEQGGFSLPAGSGPRHFVFNAAGDVVYVVNELNSTVAVLSFHQRTGSLDLLTVVETIPPAQAPHNHCSEIQLSPDGQRLVVANRGDDTLSLFRVGADGRLSSADERVATGGKTPRHFAFDPSGKYIVVANQDSDLISIHAASSDGHLRPHQTFVEGTPMCIAFHRTG